ncbi:inner centromere protein-like [Mya arenaria]|uniref:inner centromere protein-like n=1 Tax=Mya arenaria TaxID=6604 RepID=UPI0022E5C58C|nr:inner centromere protein-like [Mya arenaria]
MPRLRKQSQEQKRIKELTQKATQKLKTKKQFESASENEIDHKLTFNCVDLSVHFDVVLAVDRQELTHSLDQKTMLWSEVLKQATKQSYHTLYKQKQRSDPYYRKRENEKRDKIRKERRNDPELRQMDNEKRDKARKEMRKNPESRQMEYEKRDKTRIEMRKNPELRQMENEKKGTKHAKK